MKFLKIANRLLIEVLSVNITSYLTFICPRMLMRQLLFWRKSVKGRQGQEITYISSTFSQKTDRLKYSSHNKNVKQLYFIFSASKQLAHAVHPTYFQQRREWLLPTYRFLFDFYCHRFTPTCDSGGKCVDFGSGMEE